MLYSKKYCDLVTDLVDMGSKREEEIQDEDRASCLINRIYDDSGVCRYGKYIRKSSLGGKVSLGHIDPV